MNYDFLIFLAKIIGLLVVLSVFLGWVFGGAAKLGGEEDFRVRHVPDHQCKYDRYGRWRMDPRCAYPNKQARLARETSRVRRDALKGMH